MTLDEARERLRDAVGASGMTYQQIGLKMGYSPASARQAVSSLLSPQSNPSLSTLLRLCEVLGVELYEVLRPKKPNRAKKSR